MKLQNQRGPKKAIGPKLDLDVLDLLAATSKATGESKAVLIEYALIQVYGDKFSPTALMDNLDELRGSYNAKLRQYHD